MRSVAWSRCRPSPPPAPRPRRTGCSFRTRSGRAPRSTFRAVPPRRPPRGRPRRRTGPSGPSPSGSRSRRQRPRYPLGVVAEHVLVAVDSPAEALGQEVVDDLDASLVARSAPSARGRPCPRRRRRARRSRSMRSIRSATVSALGSASGLIPNGAPTNSKSKRSTKWPSESCELTSLRRSGGITASVRSSPRPSRTRSRAYSSARRRYGVRVVRVGVASARAISGRARDQGRVHPHMRIRSSAANSSASSSSSRAPCSSPAPHATTRSASSSSARSFALGA